MRILDKTQDSGQRLLVFTPTGRDSKLAVALLERFGHEALPCNTIEQIYQNFGPGIGVLIIADEALTAESVKQLNVRLDNQPPGLDLPIIVLTRRQSGEGVNDAFPLFYTRANVTLLERPLRTENFLSVVRNALSARTRQYEVRSLLRTLEERIQERDRFLAMLGHELRNPLSVISNSLILLGHSAEFNDNRALELASRQANLIGRLLDDLLDVARFTNGKVTLNKQSIALSEAIQSAADACFESMRQKRQHFRCDLVRNIVVNADPVRLTQLFSNLLVNASKYTPREGRIHLHCAIHDSNADVIVSDNGIGIEPDLLNRLFEPFAQAEQGLERSEGGLGLGLALAKSIAELHGGSIGVASNGAGCGSTFTVRLPIASGHTAGAPGQPLLNHAQPARTLRIILAEDDPDVAESFQTLLVRHGYEVHLVTNGRAAVTAASDLQPEVILLDIGLPDMNGYDVARAIRKLRLEPMPLLIAVSGYGQPEDRRRSGESGFAYHLVKPVKLQQLQNILTEFASHRIDHRGSSVEE